MATGALVLLALVEALLAWPAAFAADGVFPVAQLVAFRMPVALGLVALAAVAALSLVIPGSRRGRLALVSVLLAGALAQLGVLAARGWSSPAPTAGSDSTDDLVVLSFNTFGAVGSGDLATLALEADADVVVLPETEQRTGEATALLLADAGRPMTVLSHRTGTWSATSTTMLVSTDLGDYTAGPVEDTRLATFWATPTQAATAQDSTAQGGTAAGPPLLAVHPHAPNGAPVMGLWADETALVRDACRDTPGAVVAGDLNATLDHPGLRGLSPCVDAAEAAGTAGLGTWPASVPSWLGAPIDHVLVDSRVWDVASFQVLDAVGGSDHRPVVARLHRR